MDNNQQTSTPSSLDPQAVNLAKAIRQTESNGNFTAQGKSGEYGAYQFTEPTWNAYSKKFGVNVPLTTASPEQQNEVAYKQIKEWKDSGMNVGQIASMWNSGKPDAYLDPNYTGTNKSGVKYDVPAYAKSVATAYQTLKTGGVVNADPNNPSSTANPQQPTPQGETYGALFPASAGDNPLVAGAKALGNVPSSFFNLGKGLLTAALHPIQTVKGIGNAAVGGVERSYNAVTGGQQPQNDQTATFDALTNSLKNRYGSLENLQKTATNDPAGFGADVLTILEGGAGALDAIAGTATKEALNAGLTKIATPIADATKAVATAPLKLAGQTLGLETGVGYEPIKQGMQAASQGGDAMKSFTEGLRGNISPDELVTQAKDALGQVVAERSDNYKNMLQSLGGDTTTYDISPIYNEADKQLSRFNIVKNPEGAEQALDFSRSKFALDPTAQRDIETLYNYVKNYGTQAGDRTALGVDNLKQVIGGYYSPNSDYRAFSEALRKSSRSVLDNAPGYTDAMKNYSEMTDNIKDIRQSLSLGDKAMVETSFKKLTSALKNNDFRLQVLQGLDSDTGGQLLAKIAGQRLSSIVPRGLAGVLEGGIGGLTAVAHPGGILPLIGLAFTTSPRVVGEFIRALGLGAQATKKLMDLINKFVTPTTAVGGNALIRLNPVNNTGNTPSQ